MLLPRSPKICCIGLPKTGTTSVDVALLVLGYKLAIWDKTYGDLVMNGDFFQLFDILDGFDGCRDVPWCAIYKELDRVYPKSRFILTVRSPETWIRSITKHFDPDPANPRQDHMDGADFREFLFGYKFPTENPEAYLKYLAKHTHDVLEYFGDRLLVMNLEAGDEWEKLCYFLNCKIPNQPFPFANKSV
jgi:hypothetical protein